jgi:hypothetical protein
MERLGGVWVRPIVLYGCSVNGHGRNTWLLASYNSKQWPKNRLEGGVRGNTYIERYMWGIGMNSTRDKNIFRLR